MRAAPLARSRLRANPALRPETRPVSAGAERASFELGVPAARSETPSAVQDVVLPPDGAPSPPVVLEVGVKFCARLTNNVSQPRFRFFPYLSEV